MSFKALGLDSFLAKFYHDFWNLCQGTFVELIAGCFSSASIPDALNDTLITLVPKVASPSSVAQLRPISLRNTMYKVVSKIIIQKLRPLMQKVVSPAQASFIPGRQIVDNIIVGQECIKSVKYQAILNGELTERFSPSAGIRQGDHFSPYIFVLCMEKLSHIINDHVSSGTWKSVKVARNGPAISHLFFADDLILFGEASIHQAKLMKHCLDLFCGASGQQVNFDKSRICCSPNTDSGIASTIANICGSPLTDCLGNYLGVPLIQSRITKDTYSGIVDKVQRRLASWNSHTLSMAGLKWRVGNGDNILFWKDNWAGCGPLENFATISLSDDLLEWTVSDFLTEQGWNTNWLQGCLPLDVVQKNHCIHAGLNHTEVDSCIWQLTSNGEFSVKTTYLPLFTEETNHTWNWDTIWKLHVPPKIKTFVLPLFQGKLLTNVQRVRRNLASNPNCPCCNVSMESLDHLFAGVVMRLECGIPLVFLIKLLTLSLWILRIGFSSILRLVSVACKGSLGPLCSWPPCGFVGNGDVRKCLMSTLLLLIGPTFQSFNLLGSDWWQTAPGILRLPNKLLRSISAGGIIRDSTSGWIKGFVTNLGFGKILEAELWGVFRGLLFMWNEGIRRIKVECDSFTAVSLIDGETRPSHPLSSLIHSCKDMLLHDWECSISHIYRQNIDADHIAHMGQSSNLGYHVVDLPPPSIVSLLANDSIRMTTARLVPV
ncbi:unnamed protein product [Prunus armeniaca]